jgi:hypothetical protein
VTSNAERWLLTEISISLLMYLRPRNRKELQRRAPELLPEIKELMAEQKNRFRIFHEISLGEVVIAGLSRYESEILGSRRCDALVASGPPEGLPLR